MTSKHLVKHFKCRGGVYPHSNVKRLNVPDNLIDWSASWDDYNPPIYNSNSLQGKPWADPNIGEECFSPKWNEQDASVDRKSFHGNYKIVNGYPLNPCGRTGLKGRGILGKWGPNHAADPIVTRWKRNNDREIVKQDDKPVLQLCVIERFDCGELALPGGMVDPGEKVSSTLKREFMEEAMASLDNSKDENQQVSEQLDKLFAKGVLVYNGYVDDIRNTDNAWIETSAMNYHDEEGNGLGSLKLTAGDDAKNVSWVDVNRNLKLYASHGDMVKKVTENLQSFW